MGGIALSESLEWNEDLWAGKDGERCAQCKENPKGDWLFTSHLFHRNQRDANDRPDQVGREEAEHDIANPEQAKSKPKHWRESHIAESQISGIYEVDQK